MEKRKFILIIVEGKNDKREIEAMIGTPGFAKYKNAYDFRVIPYGTDITVENFIKKMKPDKNINRNKKKYKKEQRQNESIREKLNNFIINLLRNGENQNLWDDIDKEDIKEIVQVVDLDGAFIPHENIIEGDYSSFTYRDDGIVTSQISFARGLHNEKARNLLKLIDTKTINNIPYSIYYVSCNMDHVLFNKRNPTLEEKNIGADKFRDDCAKDPENLSNSIFNPTIATKESYEVSWQNIQSDCKSLQRHTNINLFFGENAKNRK